MTGDAMRDTSTSNRRDLDGDPPFLEIDPPHWVARGLSMVGLVGLTGLIVRRRAVK